MSTSHTSFPHHFRPMLFLILCLAMLPTAAFAGDWPGYDFPGGDYRHFTLSGSNPVQQCRAQCESEEQCRAFTLVPAGVQGPQPVCWLKNGEFEIVARTGMHSWLKPEYYWAATDVDRAGSDYRRVELTDPGQNVQACRTLCQDDLQCLAFTYVKPGLQGPNGMCWLKNAVPAARNAPGCYSGLIYERQPHFQAGTSPSNPGGQPVNQLHLTGVDLPGMDMANFDVPSNDYRVCLRACQGSPMCRAYTFVAPGVQGPYAHCWLKNDVPEQVANANTESGIVR